MYYVIIRTSMGDGTFNSTACEYTDKLFFDVFPTLKESVCAVNRDFEFDSMILKNRINKDEIHISKTIKGLVDKTD